ncbi:hypothetical protein LX36DRAFT_664905 [Colletotrichum falcatum]|nr:hypothetical protein LX36DRAFT_664905 [Colletotrichum falcatum]
MSKFMICFGDVRRDSEMLEKWNKFLTELRATEAWKATGYDQCSMEGGDWGWFQSSGGKVNIRMATEVLQELGFRMSETAWGAVRFDPGSEVFEPPSPKSL